MSYFLLKIETESAAFDTTDDPQGRTCEIARILREHSADLLSEPGVELVGGSLHDYNGNRVGSFNHLSGDACLLQAGDSVEPTRAVEAFRKLVGLLEYADTDGRALHGDNHEEFTAIRAEYADLLREES